MPLPPSAPAPVPDTGLGPVPVPGRVDDLAPGLRRLTAPNPGVMTGPGTNTYLVGTGDVAVVDPGPHDEVHLAAVESAVEHAGGRIRWVLVTHTHPDHAPGATALARRSGAALIGHAAVADFAPDVCAGDGWRLEAPSFSLEALYTPGHASDHLCWLLEGSRVLLSGDHVMGGVTVVIAPPDGDMAAYLASLRRLLAMTPPIEAIAPGHGRLLGTPATVVTGILAHRAAREAVVLGALEASGTASVDELVGRVYRDVDAALFPVARLSLWAHLEKLVADGRAHEVASPQAPGSAPGWSASGPREAPPSYCYRATPSASAGSSAS